MVNYNNEKFKVVRNSENGDVTSEMKFRYKQIDDIVTCTYDGGSLKKGHLIAVVRNDGSLDMRYHHVNELGEIMIGICNSTPERMQKGKIRLHEKWKWNSGDLSEGQTTLEEE